MAPASSVRLAFTSSAALILYCSIEAKPRDPCLRRCRSYAAISAIRIPFPNS